MKEGGAREVGVVGGGERGGKERERRSKQCLHAWPPPALRTPGPGMNSTGNEGRRKDKPTTTAAAWVCKKKSVRKLNVKKNSYLHFNIVFICFHILLFTMLTSRLMLQRAFKSSLALSTRMQNF